MKVDIKVSEYEGVKSLVGGSKLYYAFEGFLDKHVGKSVWGEAQNEDSLPNKLKEFALAYTICSLVQDEEVAHKLDEEWADVHKHIPVGEALFEAILPVLDYYDQFETLEELQDELGL